MRLLLDTCTFLWLAGGGAALSRVAADAIRDPSNQVFLSAVSTWEIATKYRAGRLPLPEPPDRLIPVERGLRGVLALAFDEESALHVLRLPPLHRDPFDRMLVAQAITTENAGMYGLTPASSATSRAILLQCKLGATVPQTMTSGLLPALSLAHMA